ncbi:hypothetical protein VNO77_19580 [Canavalia gladiata]|uniref:Uncharacterized protein n=1 Tax=Canavalia gladiata TaxID=3824 RepID=A0AAN9QLJ7_CANGL
MNAIFKEWFCLFEIKLFCCFTFENEVLDLGGNETRDDKNRIFPRSSSFCNNKCVAFEHLILISMLIFGFSLNQ